MSDISIVLARARVDDGIVIEEAEEQDMRVPVGKPFLVKFAYRLYETSKAEDAWKFRLRSHLSGGEEQLAEKAHQDRRMVRDSMWSFVAASHVCPKPGTYDLTFAAEVETTSKPWGESRPAANKDERKLTGRVQIVAI